MILKNCVVPCVGDIDGWDEIVTPDEPGATLLHQDIDDIVFANSEDITIEDI